MDPRIARRRGLNGSRSASTSDSRSARARARQSRDHLARSRSHRARRRARLIYSPLARPVVVYCTSTSVIRHISRSEMIVANTGGVSLSYDGDPRAAYLLLDESEPTIRRVEYDVAKRNQSAGRLRHSSRGLDLRGCSRPPPLKCPKKERIDPDFQKQSPIRQDLHCRGSRPEPAGLRAIRHRSLRAVWAWPCWPMPGPNLVANPGFETGDFTNWSFAAASCGSDFGVTTNPVDAHTGKLRGFLRRHLAPGL